MSDYDTFRAHQDADRARDSEEAAVDQLIYWQQRAADAETKLAEVLKVGPALAIEGAPSDPWNKGWNAAIRAVRGVLAAARGEDD